jgi:hypothetical protein
MKALIAADLLQTLKEEGLYFLNEVEAIGTHTPLELLEANDGAGRWNTLQVLEHLNTYYRYYIPLIDRLLAKSTEPARRYFQPGWLGGYFTRSMLPQQGQIKNKMKTMKGHSPTAELNKDQVVPEFLQWQRKFLLIIEKSGQKDIQSIRVPISIASFIRLRLGDVLMFITAHNQRHWVQIEQLLGRLPVAVS